MPATWDPARHITNDHILPYVDSNDVMLSEESRKALHTLPFERNVFKLMANSDEFFPWFMQGLSHCFSSSKRLLPSDWQLAVLLTSRILNAPYEWDVNEPVARSLPLLQPWTSTKEKIMKRDLSGDLFSDRQRLIGQFCEEVHGPANVVSLDTMNKMKSFGFTSAEIMELFMITGIYGTLARMMVSAQVDFDEPIPDMTRVYEQTFKAEIEREQNVLDSA